MSKSIYDIDQAGNVLCTYTDADKDTLKAVSNVHFPELSPAIILGSAMPNRSCIALVFSTCPGSGEPQTTFKYQSAWGHVTGHQARFLSIVVG